jgi:hypothetical protein
MKIASKLLLLSICTHPSRAFVSPAAHSHSASLQNEFQLAAARRRHDDHDQRNPTFLQQSLQIMTTASLGLVLASFCLFSTAPAFAAETKNYDGFAEYTKDHQMEKSDVSCCVNKCGDQTKALFSNPRGIKGVSCLGRCKGEQTCAMRCFAEYGSTDLNNWLSCTIEENECVKVPKNIDNSAEDYGYDTAVKKFNPSTLVGKWYKTDGLGFSYRHSIKTFASSMT